MSVLPQKDLRPVNSRELKTFIISQGLSGESFKTDTYTLYAAFWRSIKVRNYNTADNIFYRREANAVLEPIAPLSEINLEGWGSYIEIQSTGDKLNGTITFELVKLVDAVG